MKRWIYLLGAMMLGLCISFTSYAADAISVIGGADGPTSVFLAGKVGAGTKTVMWIAVVALIALLGVCIWLFSNKHDN